MKSSFVEEPELKVTDAQQDYLNERFEVVKQLAAGLAHEILNPLTSVKGFIQLMAQKETNSKAHEYMEIIIQEINRLDELIKEFAQLAEMGPPQRKSVKIKELVDAAIFLQKNEATNQNIQIEIEIPPEIPEVFLDLDQIKYVLVNLLTNAMEASGCGGIVQVKVAYIQESGQLEISILDNGPGIPENELKRIFDPFYTTKPQATGLGLPICYRIIENHHGQITVQKGPLGGAVFTVYLS